MSKALRMAMLTAMVSVALQRPEDREYIEEERERKKVVDEEYSNLRKGLTKYTFPAGHVYAINKKVALKKAKKKGYI